MSGGQPDQAAAVPGLTRSDPHGPGITRQGSPGRFRYLAPLRRPDLGGRDAGPDRGARHSAGLDGRLDLAGSARPHPGHRRGPPGPDPVPLSRPVAAAAGRAEVRAHAPVRRCAARAARRDRARSAAAEPGPGSGGGRRGPADRSRPVPHRRASGTPNSITTTGRSRWRSGTCGCAAAARCSTTSPRRASTGRSWSPTRRCCRRCARWPAARTGCSRCSAGRTAAGWQPLRSHEVSSYITAQAGGHFTAKEFRTWNATVLMALLLANAGPARTERGRSG